MIDYGAAGDELTLVGFRMGWKGEGVLIRNILYQQDLIIFIELVC